MTGPVRVVLHGGLGNQLFQYFKARVIAADSPQRRVLLYSDLLRQYAAARSLELDTLLRAEAYPLAEVASIDRVARLRLPKVLHRLTGHERLLPLPHFGTVLDGYFQHDAAYASHGTHALQAVLGAWREALRSKGLLEQPTREHVAHVRLGDFFASPAAAHHYVTERVAAMPKGCDVVTDQQSILDHAIAKLGRQGSLRIIETDDWDAWRVLARMANYRSVSTNGSTLAFWAAALGGASLSSTNTEHAKILSRLERQRPG